MDYASERTRVGDTPDPEPVSTFGQFRDTGTDVDDIGVAISNPDLEGVNGRVYMGYLYAVPCVTWGIGWSTIIENREFQSGSLEDIELILYRFARDTGAVQ